MDRAKNFNITNKINFNNDNVIVTISRHIENPGIVGTVYSSICRHFQGHSVIFTHVQSN